MRNLPSLAEHEAYKLSKLVTGGQLIPVLNNTKWAELINEMLNAGEMKPQFRTRSVFAPSDYVTNWDGDWYYHIHPVADLEWGELRAASPEWLLATLKKHSIPYSKEQGIIRVWGYTRPGNQPCWE